MRCDNARECTGSAGATDTGQLLQDQGWDVMSSLVRATCLCVARGSAQGAAAASSCVRVVARRTPCPRSGGGARLRRRRGWTRREGDEHATVESSSSCVRCWVRGERGVSLLVVCGGVTSNERRRMVGVWRSPATPVPQGTRDGVGLKLASARSARTFARVSLPAQLTDSCWRHNTERALGLARGYAQ